MASPAQPAEMDMDGYVLLTAGQVRELTLDRREPRKVRIVGWAQSYGTRGVVTLAPTNRDPKNPVFAVFGLTGRSPVQNEDIIPFVGECVEVAGTAIGWDRGVGPTADRPGVLHVVRVVRVVGLPSCVCEWDSKHANLGS